MSTLLEPGALRQLAPLLEGLRLRKLLFVLDRPAFESSGAAAILEPVLAKFAVEHFEGFELNPKVEDLRRGCALFRESEPELVLALGGGSALDMAKLIAACGPQAGDPADFATGRRPLERPGPPTLLAPTTAGTGSEATHFAVVYEGGKKHSLAHPSLLPDYAIIDPELTASLPPGPTASCGLDALSQAVESFWAVGANEESIGFATESLQLCLKHLENAVLRPDLEARHGMARAAHFSGQAINLSKTTAPHAFSYALTTRFGVPHGSAAALTLPDFLLYNHGVDEADCSDPRGPEAVRRRIGLILDLLGVATAEEARERLRALIASVGCPTLLREVGVCDEDLPGLVEAVNLERLSNNPRKIDVEGMRRLLRKG